MREQIHSYVQRRVDWSETTKRNAALELRTILMYGLDPESLLRGLKARGLKPYTIKTYMIRAAGFEETMKGTTHIKQFLASKPHLFRNAYKEKTHAVKRDEFKELLAQAPDSSAHNFLVLTGACGLRKSEALSLQWSDITDGTLVVRSGKGNKQRLVPIFQELKPTESSFVVPQYKSTRKLLASSALNVSPHDFRAMYVTDIVNRGVLSLKEAAVVAGHSSVQTTARYVRTDFNEIKAKLMKETK